jgi:hypothetical protein
MSLGIRFEKVDTAAVLRGDLGDANLTDPAERRRQRERVLAYWPEDVIALAKKYPPPWHLLLDPAEFDDVPPAEVHFFYRSFFAERRRWPALDDVRRKFGRVSHHRAPGEVEGQESLGI